VANPSGFDNYFALFHLKPAFHVDRQALESAYLAVQKEVHPDMHASKTDAEKRVAMQMATLANTAYRTLKHPVQRGLYLCSQHGVDAQLESNTAMPTEFLMQQMAWREALEESAGNPDALFHLHQEVEEEGRMLLHKIEQLIDQQADYQEAAKQLRAMLFIDKFTEELEEAMAG